MLSNKVRKTLHSILVIKIGFWDRIWSENLPKKIFIQKKLHEWFFIIKFFSICFQKDDSNFFSVLNCLFFINWNPALRQIWISRPSKQSGHLEQSGQSWQPLWFNQNLFALHYKYSVVFPNITLLFTRTTVMITRTVVVFTRNIVLITITTVVFTRPTLVFNRTIELFIRTTLVFT